MLLTEDEDIAAFADLRDTTFGIMYDWLEATRKSCHLHNVRSRHVFLRLEESSNEGDGKDSGGEKGEER